MPNPTSTHSKKFLWVLVAIGVVATIVTVVVLALSSRPTRAPVVASQPAAPELPTSEPVVLSREVLSRESRGWGLEVPHGTQVLDNVTFICEGAIRTAGLRSSRYPGAVLGIPIQRKGTKIHLLQAAENSPGNSMGSIYGRLRFHFANGQSRDFYLRFGVHGRDWFQVKRQLSDPVFDPNTRPAWVVQHPTRNVWIRLFHTTLENPFPNEEITSVDAISPLGGGNLLLFAVSTGNGPPLLQPPVSEEPPTEMLTLAFSLRDKDGAPMTNSSIKWTATVSNVTVAFPSFPCDDSGRMSIDFPTLDITRIRYTATNSEGATTVGMFSRPAGGWAPTQQIAVVFAKK